MSFVGTAPLGGSVQLFVSPVDETIYGATLSDDYLYRYRLWRTWGSGERMAWIMLNPSTADAEIDDPTIRRCMTFARREGYDGIEVINLYGLRATKPKHLLDHPDPEGPDNSHHWNAILTDCGIGMIVAAWGAGRPRIAGHPIPSFVYDNQPSGLFCLGTTQDGEPRHPLYVKGDQEMLPFAVTARTGRTGEPS